MGGVRIIKKLSGSYGNLPGAIYVLFIVRIINAMGNFIYPFLTFFLTQKIGLSPSRAADFFILASVMSMIGSLIGGKLADGYGRKKLMLAFQGMAAVLYFACAFLGNSIAIPFILSAASLFNGAAQPANSAMVTDLTNKDNRKQAMSLLYLGINLGFAIGPKIAGELYNYNSQLIFYGNAVAILLSILLVGFLVKETAPSAEEIESSKDKEDEEAAEEGNVFAALLRRPTLLLFLVGRILNQLVYATIGFAIPLQMTATFGAVAGASNYGSLMAFTGLVVILFTIPTIKLTGKNRAVLNMSLAGLFYGVGFGMLGFIQNYWLFLLAGLIFTLGEILEVTNAGIYVANHSPINHRGRFNAIIPLITGVGAMFGPKLFGVYIEAYGLTRLWVLCFVLAIISSVFMLWLRVFEDRWYQKKYSSGSYGADVDK
jgi:MFS family permease